MKRLWLLMLLLACGGPPRTEWLAVRVENESYDARRVRIYCDGNQIGVVRFLITGRAVTERFRSPSCRDVSYRIETIMQAWNPPDRIMINPGDTLVVVVKNYLPLSYHTVRQEDP